MCKRKRCCTTCGWALTHGNHEGNTRFCGNCKEKKEIGHLCYIRPLRNALPPANGKVLYVFYDFETIQNTEYTDFDMLHVLNIVCVQYFSSRYEEGEDLEGDCVRRGKKKHSFWQDYVGDLLTYLTEPRPWTNKFFAIAHNARAFDLLFILKRAILLK